MTVQELIDKLQKEVKDKSKQLEDPTGQDITYIEECGDYVELG